jgi:hypothetical protein
MSGLVWFGWFGLVGYEATKSIYWITQFWNIFACHKNHRYFRQETVHLAQSKLVVQRGIN